MRVRTNGCVVSAKVPASARGYCLYPLVRRDGREMDGRDAAAEEGSRGAIGLIEGWTDIGQTQRGETGTQCVVIELHNRPSQANRDLAYKGHHINHI